MCILYLTVDSAWYRYIVYISNILKSVFRLGVFCVRFIWFLLLLHVEIYPYIIHIFSSQGCKSVFNKFLFCAVQV